jgi:hypothetical protein
MYGEGQRIACCFPCCYGKSSVDTAGNYATTSSSPATASTYGETISDSGGERLIINAQGYGDLLQYSAVPTVV